MRCALPKPFLKVTLMPFWVWRGATRTEYGGRFARRREGGIVDIADFSCWRRLPVVIILPTRQFETLQSDLPMHSNLREDRRSVNISDHSPFSSTVIIVSNFARMARHSPVLAFSTGGLTSDGISRKWPRPHESRLTGNLALCSVAASTSTSPTLVL